MAYADSTFSGHGITPRPNTGRKYDPEGCVMSLRTMWPSSAAAHRGAMDTIAHHITVLAAAATPPSTQRSPLLYAWFALQALVLIAIIYGITRFVRRRSGTRRRQRAQRPVA